jgi:hypothetical protein
MFLLSVLIGVIALWFSTNQNEERHNGEAARPGRDAEPGQQQFVLPPSEPVSVPVSELLSQHVSKNDGEVARPQAER